VIVPELVLAMAVNTLVNARSSCTAGTVGWQTGETGGPQEEFMWGYFRPAVSST